MKNYSDIKQQYRFEKIKDKIGDEDVSRETSSFLLPVCLITFMKKGAIRVLGENENKNI